MRKLMWFTIGFAISFLLGIYLISSMWLAVLAAVCLCAAVSLFLFKRKTVALIIALVGFCIGTGWFVAFDEVYLEPARQLDGKTVSAQIEITDYPRSTEFGVAVEGKLTHAGKTYQVNAYLADMELLPGDVITGEFRFRFTWEGGEEDATYHPGKGIFLLGYSTGEVKLTRPDTIPAKYFAVNLRREIQSMLDEVFPADTVGFARALLLGDSSKLSYEEDTAFKVSGIRHIIAVSGLHVSILFSLVYLFSGKGRVLTAVLGIPVLVLFAAVAGFTPSIVRACIMQCLMMLGLLLRKEYDPPTALSFSVLVMLVVNPLTITSVSFQLSVGCMIGIFLFSGKINRFLLRILRAPAGKSVRARLSRWFAGGVSVTVSAMVITTPLSAYYFGAISIVGILTNLLTLWIVSFVFYGIVLAYLFGTFWVGAARAIAWIISWAIRYILFTAKILSAIPFAAVYTTSVYVLLWLVFCYVLFVAFFAGKRKYPFVYAVCMILGLCLSLTASYVEPETDDFRVTVLDVGQGQSILLQNEDTIYMVDCGGDYGETAADIAAQHLLSQGITSIDGLILTHYDDDHAGGAAHLLNRISVGTLYLPDIADDGDLKAELSTLENIVWVREKLECSGQCGQLTLIPGDPGKDENGSGLCILFQAENYDILITGDWSVAQEMQLIQSMQLPELELLVVGHHGARTSTSQFLLSAGKPKAAVISVGADNAYGHPADEVLDRLETYGCQIWRTDLHGTITFGR